MDKIYLHARAPEALHRAYPSGGWLIRDDADGLGPYLHDWTRPEPRPSVAEIAAMCADLDQPQPAPVPATITNFQARQVLKAAGLFEAVDAAVRASGGVLLDAWEYGGGFDRDSPSLSALAQSLGLTDAQVDDLFRQGATIRA